MGVWGKPDIFCGARTFRCDWRRHASSPPRRLRAAWRGVLEKSSPVDNFLPKIKEHTSWNTWMFNIPGWNIEHSELERSMFGIRTIKKHTGYDPFSENPTPGRWRELDRGIRGSFLLGPKTRHQDSFWGAWKRKEVLGVVYMEWPKRETQFPRNELPDCLRETFARLRARLRTLKRSPQCCGAKLGLAPARNEGGTFERKS